MSTLKKPSIATPSPKKLKTSPGLSQAISSPHKSGASPKKSPRKFRPKKYSPKKSPRKATSKKANEERLVGAGSFEDVTAAHEDAAASGRTSGEAYYTANFKDVLNKCLLPSNPERHVISEQDELLVKGFMELESE